MQPSPEYLCWREAEYRVTDAQEQLRSCIRFDGLDPHQMEIAAKVCVCRTAAARELSALLVSIKLKANSSRWR